MSDYSLKPGYAAIPAESLPDGWIAKRLGEVLRASQGGKLGLTKETDYVANGVAAFSAAGQDGFVERAEFVNQSGVVLSAIGANCGRCFYAEGDWTTLANVQALIPNEELNARFLYYRANIENYWTRSGSAQPFIKPSSVKSSWIAFPPRAVQDKITEILTTVDAAMEQTEALVGKLEQMKAGLMHDLFTRGVTPDGHLRPTRQQAPHLYHQTPLGWLPKEWELDSIGSITDSFVDGPFGSNLKTEHYVVEAGVRVVRLQNIDDGKYNDEERAFVSESHANFLMRNQVLPGDVLIAGLGEDNNVVGRACCYPNGLPPAINKADCFRLRCLPFKALNAFVMFFLNTAAARRQVRRFEQGVTRRRINTGNMKKVVVSLPSIAEQQLIVQRLVDAGAQIEVSTTHLAKLRQQKQGLMQDLLTGRVRVARVSS